MSARPFAPELARREVPDYEVRAFGGRSCRFALVVFVLNEGERIRRQLREMAPLADRVDIIVADGGSTDGALADDFPARHGVRAILTKRGPGKLSAQMRMAFAYALDEGYEGVITIDGNGKDDPSAVPNFVAALIGGCDHAQGSRFVPGGSAINTPLSRLLGIRLLHAPLISLAAGFGYTDTTNGFRAYSARFLRDPRVQPFRNVFSAYELHYYLAIRAPRLGFCVAEIPVARAYPAKGKIPTKISPVRGNLTIFRTLLAACTGRFDPPEEARHHG